jgi:glycosyltransferase involved in cell wall biosynthesis
MAGLKLLYISCHPTLEHDEIQIFHKLGFHVFSIGHYINPTVPIGSTRASLAIDVDVDLFYKFYALHPDIQATTDGVYRLHSDFTKEFDIIVVPHFRDNFLINWNDMKHKLCIWRSIGINPDYSERELTRLKQAGLKIVRMSPKERLNKDYAGEDSVIRFPINPIDFRGWTGYFDWVLTLNKRMAKRPEECQWRIYEEVTKGFRCRLIGLDNEDISYAINNVPYKDTLSYLRDSAVYFSTCTRPAPTTYSFMEALMIGIPVVTVGPIIGDSPYHRGTFENYCFIENGVNGFWSDNTHELRSYIKTLLDDKKLAQSISYEGRQTAIKHFSPNIIERQWKDFFKTLGINQ